MKQAIAILAKAPQPGKVKTRLVGRLCEEDAAELYRCFLMDTIALAKRVRGADVVVSFTPSGAEYLFESLAPGCTLTAQRGEDLGQRIFSTVRDVLTLGYESVVVIGADSPTMPPQFLGRAFKLAGKQSKPLVLGPAYDGGYYLIAASEWHEDLFKGIEWSTNRVLEQTIDQARKLNREIALLPPWYDVDSAEDLDVLAAELRHPVTPYGPRRSIAVNTVEFLKSRCLV
ncbi:MAG: TIGR04282 family arsenosugar biosynthesis glycosyltransferase [Blastocatellia bacterium]